ncbi:MAG: MFS transporter [Aliidongia sp.]
MVGTAIEYYDFYIYGTAAALVLGQKFFPASATGTQSLAAFATFGIAFLARPLGSFLFGHFGDRIGRKSTLVASLVTMGPFHHADRRPARLCECRRPGPAPALPPPPGPGHRPGRGVGRCRAARDRERTTGSASLVRHVPAARPASRFPAVQWAVPPAVFAPDRGPVHGLGLAHSRSSPAPFS